MDELTLIEEQLTQIELSCLESDLMDRTDGLKFNFVETARPSHLGRSSFDMFCLGMASARLGLRMQIPKMFWFREALASETPTIRRSTPIIGLYRKGMIFIHQDLRGGALARVIFHEVRHAWQDRNGHFIDSSERLEADAQAFESYAGAWPIPDDVHVHTTWGLEGEEVNRGTVPEAMPGDLLLELRSRSLFVNIANSPETGPQWAYRGRLEI